MKQINIKLPKLLLNSHTQALMLVIVLLCSIYSVACKKNTPSTKLPLTPIDYSNVSLLDKPLDTIRKAISGRWQIHYDSTYGYTGWTKQIHNNDFLTFLTNDTIKNVVYGNTIVYAKAIITRNPNNWGPPFDSVYTFNIPSNLISYTMIKIFNDTLKIQQAPRFFFLTKSP